MGCTQRLAAVHRSLYWFSLSPHYSSRFACVRRNPWIQGLLREMLAEFIGTVFFMFIGLSANAQLTLGKSTGMGSWLSMSFGWGLALCMAIYVAGGVSGAHFNPAVTVAMATHRGFELYKVLPFMFAQFTGAFVGSALTFAVYFDAINAFEDVGEKEFYSEATAGIFCTMESVWLTTRGAIVDNVVGTALLLLGLSALSDAKNFNPVAGNLAPLLIGLFIVCVNFTIAINAGAAINPVRDFPQRLFISLAGWGPGIFSRHESYWWIPLVMPYVGAQLGMIVYDICVGVHHDEAQGAVSGDTVAEESFATAPGDEYEVRLDTFQGVASNAHDQRSRASSRARTGGEAVNINAIGGKASVGLSAPSGMVHVNEAFLDPAIKASADSTFHAKSRRKQSAQRQASDTQPLLEESKAAPSE